MYRLNSRAVGVILGAMLTALAACADDPSPTGPIEGPELPSAVGDVFTVTNLSGGTEVGSLRWALSHVTGGEVIRFAPALAGQTVTLDSTIKVWGKHFTLEGPADAGITISGGDKVRVFDLDPGTGETVLRNLTIAHGNAAGAFGGDQGAGITVRGLTSASVRVENSTLTGNVANGWSAISGVTTTLVNTTVSGNTATSTSSNPTPAILSTNLTLVNSTIAHNASAGLGFGSLVLRNSIISNHPGKPNCVSGNVNTTYEGNNLSDDDTCGGPLDLTIGDAQLGALADNGGPTMTHALLAGSPAINGGEDCSVTVDQRYGPRDAQCDLGAFEFIDFTTVALTTASSATVDGNGWAVVTGTVTCSRNETFALRVRLHQTQKSGRGTSEVESSGTTPIACTTSVRSWSVSLGTANQAFQSGSAVAGVSTLNTEAWVTPASISQSVRLFKGRK